MSRHFIEGGSSYGPGIFARLEQGLRAREHRISTLKQAHLARRGSSETSTPTLATLHHNERGGNRLVYTLLAAIALLGGSAGIKILMDNTGVKAQVEAPPDLGLGVKIVDNPPVGVGGSEPPPQNGETRLVFNPPKDASPKEPQLSPVEKAIQAGRIEVKNGEWDKYFIAINPTAAEALLAEGNKMIFPFDPRKSPNLVIEVYEWATPNGSPRAFLALKNIGLETISYAPVSGQAANKRGAIDNQPTSSWGIKKGNDIYSFGFPRNSVIPLIPYDQETDVSIGTPLMRVTANSETMPFYAGGGVYQAVGGMGLNSRVTTEINLAQLAQIEGRIAFIGMS